MFQLVAIGIAVYSYFEIRRGLPMIALHGFGPAVLRVTSGTVWITFFVEILMTAVFLAVPFIASSYPQAVHFGAVRLSDYSAAQRARIVPLVKRMVALWNVADNLFFATNIHFQIQAGLQGGREAPSALWARIAMLVVAFAVITYFHVQRFYEAANEE